MNEQLQVLLDAVRRSAELAGEHAADAAWAAGKRADALVSAARLRMRSASLEDRVESCLAEIGEMLYATHTGHPTDSDALLEKLREVDGLRAEIARLERQRSRLQGRRVCPVCGAAVREGDIYCRECGGKL